MFHIDLSRPMNLLKDDSVVTQDGEYLGTWNTDESDAMYGFTPDGAAAPLLCNVFVKFMCDSIKLWHSQMKN